MSTIEDSLFWDTEVDAILLLLLLLHTGTNVADKWQNTETYVMPVANILDSIFPQLLLNENV